MNDGHRYILSFLHNLHQIKGPHGVIELNAYHWFTNGNEACNPSAQNLLEECKLNHDQMRETRRPPDGVQVDGILHQGELIEFEITSIKEGYIHLFSFGTDAHCIKLAPTNQCPDNFLTAGQIFCLPSRRIISGCDQPPGYFQVTGPVSSDNYQKERLVAIMTYREEDLQINDLHLGLWQRVTLKRGFKGNSTNRGIKIIKPKLFRLPIHVWDYGLLELEIRE